MSNNEPENITTLPDLGIGLVPVSEIVSVANALLALRGLPGVKPQTVLSWVSRQNFPPAISKGRGRGKGRAESSYPAFFAVVVAQVQILYAEGGHTFRECVEKSLAVHALERIVMLLQIAKQVFECERFFEKRLLIESQSNIVAKLLQLDPEGGRNEIDHIISDITELHQQLKSSRNFTNDERDYFSSVSQILKEQVRPIVAWIVDSKSFSLYESGAAQSLLDLIDSLQ